MYTTPLGDKRTARYGDYFIFIVLTASTHVARE